MPYASSAQQRFFHSSGAAKAGISKKTVKEYDKATKGKYQDLPEKVEKKASFADVLLKLAIDHEDRSLVGDIGAGGIRGLAIGGVLGGLGGATFGAIAPDISRAISRMPGRAVARRVGSRPRMPRRIPVGVGERTLSTLTGAGVGLLRGVTSPTMLTIGAGAGALAHYFRRKEKTAGAVDHP